MDTPERNPDVNSGQEALAAALNLSRSVRTPDPLQRVHHHNWHPTAGKTEQGFCGSTVVALTPEHASTLPCCPMCALVLAEHNWTCIAGKDAA